MAVNIQATQIAGPKTPVFAALSQFLALFSASQHCQVPSYDVVHPDWATRVTLARQLGRCSSPRPAQQRGGIKHLLATGTSRNGKKTNHSPASARRPSARLVRMPVGVGSADSG